MPDLPPPWKPGSVREDYAAGTWAYALGKPAWTHRDYGQAVEIAQRAGWNPWYIRNCSDVRATIDGCYYDDAAATKVVRFFPFFKHVESDWGRGNRFYLADWQEYDVTRPLFGWKRANGYRRFRRGYIRIPKKNGKSSWASVIGLFALVGDGENGPKIIAAAAARDQARIIFGGSAAMVKASPELSKRLKVLESIKEIRYPKNNGDYTAISADANLQEGKKLHFTLVDESHAHKNRTLIDTLRYGGDARKQPMFLVFTTAGVYDPTSIGWQLDHAAMQMLDDTKPDWVQFAYCCGLNKDEYHRWAEPEMAKKANPSWGITIDPEKTAEACLEAQNDPTVQNSYKRYRLNIWTQQTDVWISADMWEPAELDYSEDDLLERQCEAGLDLSSSEDLTALVLWFPALNDSEPHRMLEYFFCPRDQVIKHDKDLNNLYSAWIDAGWITDTPGKTVNYDAVRMKLIELSRKFYIPRVYIDPWNAGNMVQSLTDEGYDVVKLQQSCTMLNEPTRHFKNLLKDGKLKHRTNDVMRYHISCCELYENPLGLQKVQKLIKVGNKNATVRLKIDGVAAAINALYGVLQHTDEYVQNVSSCVLI